MSAPVISSPTSTLALAYVLFQQKKKSRLLLLITIQVVLGMEVPNQRRMVYTTPQVPFLLHQLQLTVMGPLALAWYR